jgi:hypothetical protein
MSNQMAKWSKIVIIALLLAILYHVRYPASTFTPAPLVTKSNAPTGDMFDLKHSLECTAGPSEKAAYYSKGLAPGGMCGDNDYVRQQIRDYDITDGIGGSLLEK